VNFANLLCDGHEVTALLDFEWARLGARDQELEPFLRAADWAGTGDAEMIPPVEMGRILGWLAVDYPQLFAHPDLADRLWLYQLAYTVRELFTWPPPRPGETVSADHPARLLPGFAAGRGHLRRVLPAP
jgi:hypothetical protein